MPINDLALLLDIFGNSEGTILLIWIVMFCLVFTSPAKLRVELREKSANIVTDALHIRIFEFIRKSNPINKTLLFDCSVYNSYAKYVYPTKRKGQRSNAAVWQKTLNERQCIGEITQSRYKNARLCNITDRVRTVSWSDNSHPTSVVNLRLKGLTFPLPAIAM